MSAISNSRVVVAAVVLLLVVACGGAGSGGSGVPPGAWVAGSFAAASTFQARCAVPRSGINPATGRAYPDVQGSTLTENNWLRSWSNDLYLWFAEIVDRDPAGYGTLDYFDVLKTTALTPSGRAKDRFHFHLATSDWLSRSQSGVAPGYGATWALVSASPPRRIIVAYTEPGSPATSTSVNLARGAAVLGVDGIDAVNDSTQAAVDALNAALFPTQVGASHTFVVQDQGATTTRSVTMTAVNVTSAPVQNVRTFTTSSGPVGYMLFNDHLATAEQALIDAITQLDAAGVTDLILDIRYNGGGFLDIASEAAYMIAGPGRTAGKTFELTAFNSKYPTNDPVTGRALVPQLFESTANGFSAPAGQPLPTLDLPRVFVLTGPNTCSASESIINALQGIDVDVIQIGSTTCGKPYGFYPQDNCGTTYFSIEFKGVNAKGFGDYSDGFSPANTTSSPGAVISGCSVADDYAHALGDPLERRLAAALAYRAAGTCPAPSGLARPGATAARPEAAGLSREAPLDGIVVKPAWLQNRIMRR